MGTTLKEKHRECLLEQLDMANNELSAQKELLNEKQEEYKEQYEVKVFLAQQKIDVILNAIVKNSIEYKKTIN